MIKGWQLFAHSLRMVFGNLGVALKLTGPVLLLFMCASVPLLGVTFALSPATGAGNYVSVGAGLIMFVFLLALMVVFLAITIDWHRYILLGEVPKGWFPTFKFGRMFVYFGKGFLIVLIVLIPISALLYIALLLTNGSQIALLLSAVLAVTVFYRFCAALPGIAVDESTGPFDGWTATKGAWMPVLVLAVLSLVVQVIDRQIAQALIELQFVAIIYDVISSWILTMVSLSMLTTLYGHYIEGRDLT